MGAALHTFKGQIQKKFLKRHSSQNTMRSGSVRRLTFPQPVDVMSGLKQEWDWRGAWDKFTARHWRFAAPVPGKRT
jgi:hypothetical protein